MSNLRYEVAPGVKCETCGAEAVGVKAHAGGYDFCEICHYTGRAESHVRQAQLDDFRAKLPGWTIDVEHTGGGCFWLAFYPPDAGGYMYAATEGEASLPSVDEKPIRGGWGYVGRYFYDSDDDAKTEAHPDYEGTIIVEGGDTDGMGDEYWNTYPALALSDDQIVEAIRSDWDTTKKGESTHA